MSKKQLDIIEYAKNMGTQRSALMAVAHRVMDGSINDMDHVRSSLELVFHALIESNSWVDDSVEDIVRPTVETFFQQQKALRETKQIIKDKS